MNHHEIRKKFIDFFIQNGYLHWPASNLIPTDPSVLFTTAGMQQFKLFYEHPELAPARKLVTVQPIFRTSDIDEVGDETHLTLFEMLGNFAFGANKSFKKEAIELAWRFVQEELQIAKNRISVSAFAGDLEVPEDTESQKIWRDLGVTKIFKSGREDNFWGPVGAEGPCGPTTEIYIDGIEIWNLVFNEYYKEKDGRFRKLAQPGVDTGMGLERLAAILQDKKTVFETDIFAPLFSELKKTDSLLDEKNRSARVIADHIRGIVFLIADGVSPSNKEQGYILRRLLRRVIVYLKLPRINFEMIERLALVVIGEFGGVYKNLLQQKKQILETIWQEIEKFSHALDRGMKEFEKEIEREKVLNGKMIFHLYDTYGFPVELTEELAHLRQIEMDKKGFELEFERHKEISRAGAEKKFGGHGLFLDTGELKAGSEEEIQKVTHLHTATHLLHAALREVLDSHVHQRGSDINPERLRFDFEHGEKLTPEQIKKVEDLVNAKIIEDLPVNFVELSLAEAEKTGALHYFGRKYPEKVRVYFVGPDLKSAFSKEFCGGPHVSRTAEIGRFRIAKEESSSAGVRRIKAVLEY